MRINRRQISRLVLGQVAAMALGSFPAKADAGPSLGFNLVSWDTATLSHADPWIRAIHEIHRLGARRITLIPYVLVDMSTAELTQNSRFGLDTGPSRPILASAMSAATRLGLEVSLKPFVEIDDGAGEGVIWRGLINFSDDRLGTFFASYERYFLGLADLAQSRGVTRFYIGSELAALTRNPQALPYWTALIEKLRRRYQGPSRRLTYAANFDEYRNVPFWHLLDEIGIDAYFPLANEELAAGRGRPSVDEITMAWTSILPRLRAYAGRLQRPLFFSEWGVVPFDLTTTEPSKWQPSQNDDAAEARNAYLATLEATSSAGNWLSGIDFWHWAVNPNDDSNYRISQGSEIASLLKRFMS